jgi:acetyltransferase-like isoleucine patch superfamily enzyme
LIKHHAWIASGVTVLPNVVIGAGAVVGAGSVVTKSIPDLQIWAGNPAKYQKQRDNALGYKLQYRPTFE